MVELEGENHFAVLCADFDTAHSHLQLNPGWGADTIQIAGEYRWRVYAARTYSKGPFGARVIDENPNRFIAWGVYRKRSCLAYRINRDGAGIIRVIPLAYLERTHKARVVVSLAFPLLIPALFSPLFWLVYASRTLRASRLLLPAFCQYLEKVTGY
ncbi:MAG: hypothetical protein WCK35_09425 [Chloroflexota bacterium]